MKTEGHESCQISAARGGVRAEGQLQAAAFTFPLDASTEPPPHDTQRGELTVGDTVLYMAMMAQLYQPLAFFGSNYRQGGRGQGRGEDASTGGTLGASAAPVYCMYCMYCI